MSLSPTTPPPNQSQYNKNCPAVKRLYREAVELALPTYEYAAHPIDDNLFEWHFTIRGPSDSEFELGIYHGRILFPPNYPMGPPAFSFLTPNGRFTTGEKICLSISNYHPEAWLPSWSVRTAILAIISFMTTPGNLGNIGELNYTKADRICLAKKSVEWACPTCGAIKDLIRADKNLPLPDKKVENARTDDAVQGKDQLSPNSTANPQSSILTPIQVSVPLDKNQNPSEEGEAKVKEGQRVVSDTNDPVTTTLGPNTSVESRIFKSISGLIPPELSPDEQVSETEVLTSSTNLSVLGATEETVQFPLLQESYRNFLYDFAIGFVIVLIVGLFVRRLCKAYFDLKLD